VPVYHYVVKFRMEWAGSQGHPVFHSSLIRWRTQELDSGRARR